MAIKFGRPLESKVRFVPVETGAPASAKLELTTRPRRNRRSDWARRMVREHVLTTDDLIWPLFLIEGERTRVPVAAMPGVDRLSIDEALREAERAMKLDIPAIAFFPYTDPSLKDERGSEAFNHFRGTSWMPLPCRACDRREVDFGGCRCQAFLLTGDAAVTDPACSLSPHRPALTRITAEAADAPAALQQLHFRSNPPG